MRPERRQLPRLDERHRCVGHVAQHRLRQTHLAGRSAAHRRHGGQARPAVLRRAGHRPRLRPGEQRKPRRLHQAPEPGLVHAGPDRGQRAGVVERRGHVGLRRRVVPAEPGRQALRPARQRGGRHHRNMRPGGARGPGQHAVERPGQGRHQRHRGQLRRLGRLEPADVGQDRHHRGAPVVGLRRLHQPLRGGQLHLRRFTQPVGPVLLAAAPVRRRQPLRRQRAGQDLVHRDDAAGEQLRRRHHAADRSTLCRRRTRLEGPQRLRAEPGHRPRPAEGGRLPGGRPGQPGQQRSVLRHRRGHLTRRSDGAGFDHHHSHQQRHPAGAAAPSAGCAATAPAGR